MSFVHLHTHSEYSLLEAANSCKDLASRAKKFSQPAMALTDLGNMFGAIEFYFAALESQVKPIIGLEVYLAPESRLIKTLDRNQAARPLQRLVLLAQDLEGYKNLCRLSTVGYQEGFYYKPRVDYETLAKYNGQLIALTGGISGEIYQSLIRDGIDVARQKLKLLKSIYQDRLYLEILKIRNKDFDAALPLMLELGESEGVPVVAANEAFYLEPDDKVAQEVLVCIGTNRLLQDESKPKLPSELLYVRSTEEMFKAFSDIPHALSNTLEITERTNVKFKLKDAQGKPIYYLPSFPVKDGITISQAIRDLALKGLSERFAEALVRKEPVREEDKAKYFARLDFELAVIEKMGFNGYFMIVADFINWAKSSDIPVGPGRGSGAGSLVAYSLRITDLDPVPYDLLFERFLNPERISMPDFDIDFCQDRRGEVIRYVSDKYGVGSVSQIITYGKLQAKAAIKDVGRVLGMSFADVDMVSKLIPEKPGTTISQALEQEPRLKEMMELNPQVDTLVGLALKIEGFVRNAGIHAAGVIIADGDLQDHAPLYRGAEGENVVQYDMKFSEKIGLIKFDFLGLKTLTHIQRALNLIERNRNIKLKPHEISLHDEGMYKMMSAGDTAGVFQFEGEGITAAIRQIRPGTFADITAINALYRPGPMAMIPDFAKRKHGESEVEYLFPELSNVLSETYGIIVYQEQVMAIASLIAGYSLGEADMLRRAMGKKIKEEMDSHRIRFLKGAAEKGFEQKKSEELFELMYKFADYGFNKSHAAAYCVIAAQTAYLKCYYPAEFFAALLSTEMGDTDKVVKYVKDAQKRGLEVRPPSLNGSDYLFNVIGDTIYFGLGAIKGMGEGLARAIVECRESLPQKKFTSLQHFFEVFDARKLNKKVIEALAKAGAFDELGASRSTVIKNYPSLIEWSNQLRDNQSIGQASLFDVGDSTDRDFKLDEQKPWSRSEQLFQEKEVLGFYLSDHPLKGYENLMSLWSTSEIGSLAKVDLSTLPKVEASHRRQRDAGKPRVTLAGLVIGAREVITKKGPRMAFARLEDLSGSIEIVIFPDVYAKYEELLKQDRPVLLAGLLETEDGQFKVIVDSMISLEVALTQLKMVSMDLTQFSDSELRSLVEILKSKPGTTRVEFTVLVPELSRAVVMTSEEISGLTMNNELMEELYNKFGRSDFVKFQKEKKLSTQVQSAANDLAGEI